MNVAYQFEARGLALTYEVKQAPEGKSSIDFLRALPSGDHVYLEVRLLQEAQAVLSEQRDIYRLQSTILSKVQNDEGAPIKFFSTGDYAVTIIVIDASSSISGSLDLYDCIIATHGDRCVEGVLRRGVFGLFQEARTDDPSYMHTLAAKYRRVRQILHGVLFLFRRDTEMLAYEVEPYLIWNPTLIDDQRAQAIYADITRAIPFHREGR